MKFKEIILCSLTVIVSCVAVFIFSPILMAQNSKNKFPTMENKSLPAAAGSDMAQIEKTGVTLPEAVGSKEQTEK